MVVHKSPMNYDINSLDERLMDVIGKLILNSAFLMNDRSIVEETGPGHKWWNTKGSSEKNRGYREVPKLREYTIGRDFKRNLKNELVEYIKKGKGSAQKLQTMVCGHAQRYGKADEFGNKVWKWKEPYWRGDLESNIKVRRIVFGKEED